MKYAAGNAAPNHSHQGTESHAYRFTPAMVSLLCETLPLLFRSKDSLLDFFESAGTPRELLTSWRIKLQRERNHVPASEIAGAVLEGLVSRIDTLDAQRLIIERVAAMDDFTRVWSDHIKARANLARVRAQLNDLQSAARAKMERENERRARQSDYTSLVRSVQERAAARERLKSGLFGVFTLNDAARAEALCAALAALFTHYGIGVIDRFTLRERDQGREPLISGAVQIDGSVYLVETRWANEPVGVDELAEHIARVRSVPEIGGIYIAVAGFNAAAVERVAPSPAERISVLCGMEEIVRVIDSDGDLIAMLRSKIQGAARISGDRSILGCR